MRQPVPFGKYLLLDRVSVGGMAEVFKAKSYGVEGFEKIIAIKRILPTMGEDRDFIKMFIDEAKIAGQLAHANICQIFELGRIDGSHFIAMEYIWGKDLLQIQNRLRKIKQEMPIPMACFCIAKVLEGLDYAHRKRDPLGRPLEIVHRDCSPQNVLVSYEGEVKVIDFGIAKATSRNSRTMAGVLKGKFGYMSPEQVRGLPLDRRSDIFALGTMLYECLTGDRLFQGETDFSTLEKVRNVDVPNPRAVNPKIPEEIERVIMKALAKDVDDRYQWCSEMLADLQKYLMAQDVVFTAKSLSGWLKDVFSGEIDKERQLLETYKRVGRDGLIAGVPAADAKMDVVDSLGEAGDPEGDSTQLGGPNFDDLESALAAKAAPQSVGPALGSPASRGPSSTAPPAMRSKPGDRGSSEDFGEEAPTEIFGELEHGAIAAASKPAMPAAPPAALPSVRRPPTASQAPATKPPKPPAGRSPTNTGAPPVASGLAAQSAPSAKTTVLPPGSPGLAAARTASPSQSPGGYASPAAQAAKAAVQQGYQAPAGTYPPPVGYGQQPPMSGPPPAATPVNPAAGNYGPNYRVTGQQAAYTAPPQPQHALPTQMQPQPPYSSQPNMAYAPQPQFSNPIAPASQPPLAHPSHSSNPGMYAANANPGYPQSGPYGAVEHPQGLAPEGSKRSSIARDVAIGIAIAGLVLGGFLAVKFLVLDSGKGSGGSKAPTIATVLLKLPAGVAAELFIDDKKIATVRDGQEFPVSAGSRKVKIVGPNGAKCEQQLELAGGKKTPVECALKAAEVPPTMDSGSGAGSGAGSGGGSAATGTRSESAAGSAAATGSGSGVATGSAGSGSADAAIVKPTDTSTTTPAITKPADKPVTTPAITKPADKPVTTPAITKPADKPVTTPAITKPADKPANTPTKPADKPAPTTTTKVTSKPATKPAEDKSISYLIVQSKPSAKISIDGVSAGSSTPTGKIQVTPGRHKVTFTVGDDKFTFPVMVKAGETFTLSKDLP